MKHRIAALAAIAGVSAVVAAPSQAQTTTTLPKVTSSISKRVALKLTKSSARFGTTGTLTYSTKPRFPVGTTDPNYSSPAPTKAEACRGTVRVSEYRGERLIARRTVGVKSNCSYASSTTISRNSAYGRIFVRVRFLGNSVLKPDNAPSSVFTISKKK